MLILFNKPYQVLSQFNENPDQKGQRTLAEFNFPTSVHPIGRLDYDSEGLLLLSDDLTQERTLLHPSKNHERTYLVQIDGHITEEQEALLQQGGLEIKVGGKTHQCKPAKVKKLFKAPDWLWDREIPVDPYASARSSWLELTLTEGKNRQVRRMTARLNLPTLRLIRKSILSYSVHTLSTGEHLIINY